MKKIILIALTFLVFCAHRQYRIQYVDTAFDTSQISRIAIFDFDNKTDFGVAGSYAAERLKCYLDQESDFMVISGKKTKKAVKELFLCDKFWMKDSSSIKKIGRYLAVDALIMGSVTGIEDSHTQFYYTKNFDASFEINIEIWDTENANILYNSKCFCVNDGISINNDDSQFFQKRITRQLIDQCVQKLSVTFLPRKDRIPVEQ